MGRRVALLRGINVGGRVLPMAALRELCARLGWEDVSTYIASGNLLFHARGSQDGLEGALEQAILAAFGMKVPVVVRTAPQLQAYLDGNPFLQAARDEPNRLLLLVPKKDPASDAEEKLQARAQNRERVGRAGDALWVWFPNGIAGSKLSPLMIDKLVDSPATSRNWRTIKRLHEMLQ